MHWHQMAENPEAIVSLYESVPSLQSVELYRLLIEERGPTLELSFREIPFPDRPPVRWQRQGFNAVAISLALIEFEALRIDGWPGAQRLDITFDRNSAGWVTFTARGGGCVIETACHWLRIASFRGHVRSDNPFP